MKKILTRLSDFAHTPIGENVILTLILIVSMVAFWALSWALFAQGWN